MTSDHIVEAMREVHEKLMAAPHTEIYHYHGPNWMLLFWSATAGSYGYVDDAVAYHLHKQHPIYAHTLVDLVEAVLAKADVDLTCIDVSVWEDSPIQGFFVKEVSDGTDQPE